MADRSLVVRLRAEVNQAVAGLDKTATAAERASVAVSKTGDAFEKASRRQQDAAGRLRVAEAQLLEVQGNSNAKASQLVAAEEKVASARREVAETSQSAANAEQVLQQAMADSTQAARESAQAAKEAAEKQETAFSKMTRNAEANAQAWSTAGTALATYGGAVVGLAAVVGKTGIEYNTLQQTSRAAMSTLMGGAKEANAQMDKLDEFARSSPFAKQTFIQAQQQLIGFGVEAEKVVPTLEAVQDAVAAFGGSNQEISSIVDIMARLQSQGRLSGEALERFGYYGVDAAKIIAEQMGTTSGEIKDMASKPGGIPVEQIWDPLVDGLTERFGGAAANVKETFDGAIDRVKAAWRDLSASITEPLVGPSGGGLAVDGLNALADAMRQFEGLPDPVRNSALAVGGLSGAASLAAGSFLLLAPRLVETRAAFQTLSGQDDLVGKFARGMGKAGPAIAQAAVAVGAAVVAWQALDTIINTATNRSAPKIEKLSAEMEGLAAHGRAASGALEQAFGGGSSSWLTNTLLGTTGAVTNLDEAFGELSRNSGKIGEVTLALQKVQPGKQALELATEGVAAYDDALVQMAEGGASDKAAAAFDKIADRLTSQGHDMDFVVENFSDYEDLLKSTADTLDVTGLSAEDYANWMRGEIPDAVREAADANAELADGLAGIPPATEDAATGVATLSAEAIEAQDQLNEMFQELYNSSQGFVDFAEKAVDADVSMRDWIKSMEDQVVAQETWHENLQKLIDRGAPQELVNHFIELGSEGAFRVKQLADGSEEDLKRAGDAFVDVSEQAAGFAGAITQIPDINLEADDTTLRSQLWIAERALEDLHEMEPSPVVDAQITALEDKVRVAKDQLGDLDTDEAMPLVGVSGADESRGKIENVHESLLNIPDETTPKVDVDDTPARSTMESLWTWIRGKTIWFKTDAQKTQSSELNPDGRSGSSGKFASGGAIRGPGSGTSDSVPAWLSNGEHVWTAEEVRRAGGQQVMYAMRQAVMGGGLQAFAGGGAVGSARDRLAQAERDLERIQNAGRKVTAEDRRREAAQKRVTAARDALRRAEERQRDAERRAEERKREQERRRREEAARRERVTGLRTDLRTDVRRGSIRDQVTGSLSGGYSAVDRLFGLGENKDLSRSARSTATASARRFESNLRRLYGQAERVEEKLKDAQETAKELEGIQSSVASSISRNAYSLDVTSQWSQNAQGVWSQTSGVSGVRTNAAAAAARAKELATKLGRLQKMGYAGAILQEVAQAGSIDASIEMADALLEGTGADVKSINASYSSIEKYAAQAGKYVTGGFYKGGVDAAQGVVKGLESQQASIEKQIESLAKGMEAVFKQVLGIRSPSRVMAELGEYTVEGLVRGMLSGQSDVTNAASLLAGAAVPAIALDVKASPVMDTDALAATSAMQDMSDVTLQAMQMMRADVSAGWDSMLSDTQSKQFSMRDITAQQQELMRATILGKQVESRAAVSTEQEAMRSVMADKQSQMRDRNRAEFESMRATTGEKLTSMRSSADSTMTGFKGDYDSHMGSLKRINRDGHTSMEDASEDAFRGIRSGMNAQMREAKPELGGKMNNLIGVLAKFTSSVNKAFGDVGVDLDSPQRLAFAAGGVMPGYTPGRDVHSFYSPTAGSLYLSGGEAIMRPEFTRAVGGERGVKELNDAARRGDHEHLNLAMHFANGGVMPSSAPVRGVNAFADSGVWRGLWSIVRGAFPQSRLTSAYRGGSRTASGNSSYHSRGMAVDLAGRYQMDTSTMGQIAEWLVGNYGGSNEIIYSPLNGRQVKDGRNYMYTGAVRGMHFNHVHWANRSVPGGATGGPSGAWDGDVWIPHPFLDKAGVSADGDLKAAYERAAKKQISDIIGKHTGQLSGGEFSRRLGAGIMRATRDGLIKKATDYGELMGDGGIPGAANGPVKQMAREVLEKMGWGDQWSDLDWLVTRESGWNPNAQNPTSTAYGLFQFLNGTWGSVGASKTSDPLKQIQAGLKYIQQRYGDVRGARRFWERNNWYADGTKNAKSGWAVVGEEGPELINLGGGERIESNPQTRKALAANRTFLPTQSQQIDFDKLGQAIAKALPNQDIAAALNGAQMTLNVDGRAMTGFVHTAVGSGYSESRSRLSKSSSKVGAR